MSNFSFFPISSPPPSPPPVVIIVVKRWLFSSECRFSHIDNTGRVVVKNLKNQDVNFAGFSRGFLVNKAARTEMNIPKCDKIFQGKFLNLVVILNYVKQFQHENGKYQKFIFPNFLVQVKVRHWNRKMTAKLNNIKHSNIANCTQTHFKGNGIDHFLSVTISLQLDCGNL